MWRHLQNSVLVFWQLSIWHGPRRCRHRRHRVGPVRRHVLLRLLRVGPAGARVRPPGRRVRQLGGALLAGGRPGGTGRVAGRAGEAHLLRAQQLWQGRHQAGGRGQEGDRRPRPRIQEILRVSDKGKQFNSSNFATNIGSHILVYRYIFLKFGNITVLRIKYKLQ